jgi:hypothetical protein
MPNQFNLTSGTDTLTCDIAGQVTQGGAAFGTWTVTKDNQISIQPTAGAATSIPVNWSFSAANELTLAQPGTTNSFNFFADAGVDPGLTTKLAVLTVQPDVNGAFSFDLRPTWKIEANFDMTVTIGTVVSKIDGLVGDAEDSSFDYVFQTTGSGAIDSYQLNFTGKWGQQTVGNADLTFVYDKEADAGGNTGTFDLPDGLGMDTTRNVLVYRANKNDQSTTIALIGTLTINENFHLTYEIESKDTAGVQSSHLMIEADLVQSSIGDLTLKLDLKKTAGTSTIEISGQYRGVVKGANLTVGFSYTRQVQGQQVTQTVGFQGQVQVSGDTFVWAVTAGQQGIDITAHVTFTVGTTCTDAALNFHSGQGQIAVTAMFSITTNCTPAHP